ncbi:retrovirus-related pol polyprotein from transposon TNT 1-94 [Tanacetum coccineum]
MAEDDKIKIDKFDGHDFGFGKMHIEYYLYQKKLYEPLAEAKPTGMKAEDRTLLDRQALGVVRLSLAKNVAYNIDNEKTTYGLFKALSNMYEKLSASNKVFLIRQLVNTKMKEGASIADHVNEFNSILSRLMSVDIKLDNEVQALLLLSSLPESWSGTVTAVRGSTETTKLKFDNIRDLILGEDIPSKDKKVRMAVRDYDDALVCCVENTIDDRIMDDGVSFHATYCKEYWTLKDVRYIPGLKKRLITDGQLDEEGYHVGFGDQQWNVTKGSLVVAHGNKRGSLYMVEVPSDGINAAIDGKGNAALWHQRLGHMSEKGMQILASKGMILDLQKAVVGFCEPCVLGKQKKVDSATMLPLSMTTARRAPKDVLEWQGKEVSLAHLKVFGCNSYVKVKDVARDKLDAKSIKCTFICYASDEMGYRFWDSKGHKPVPSPLHCGGKYKGGFGGNVRSCGGSCVGRGGRGGSIVRRGGGSLAKHSMESKDGLGGGGFIDLGGRSSSWVGASGGEVKGGGVDFGVSRTLIGEIPSDIMGESVGETFGVNDRANV